ncbi:MAG: 3-hydroxyacyl-CoA dehydrogenase/enoyl-CoA hydratase family protein [Candidatus Marinimicrobia bacterium]|jgi:enoyl-CoA hydratase / 3-hydroxyacyl-CoA dehydrogenase|nr:3-hydroxyacyl-CoA dehydrogenase/enoyl-CoA hydratase family protein [Candidatus Neomarinimicrobiota bacterium]MBT3633985.1 3-hydroxyacyl-CoA dehydrogenase/enoyl-CoA hydratase family protein [Candidatus Neomarinimicrobiota bacterium]MBT3683741.1 3-hydroxyacyl-CoA dehydrogenase/enoyl-CoA hydratase family protein [Candidatus Neomarinimicrobiota bacterium]MBT3760621.1 3-hydroxyacyl-CoA dehydrogenase/enoyl-CoA hydratase family protein [Candidatus Neomarinimicrobiota bacterium]MBT3895780.1 3-hydrox
MKIQCVGIVGAGTMGAALSQKFAQEGLEVLIVDREEKFLAKGLSNIKSTLEEGVSRRIFTTERVTEILGKISPTTDLSRLVNCQLIIEAVFEDLNVKNGLFRHISSIVPEDTILASNTSSFSISELARAVSHPERFLGLHFFFHAAKNRLVEIVKGDKTSEQVFDNMMQFMQRIGKDPIVCKDAHGFVVNRFFVPWLNEAVRIYEEGIADIAAIETAACRTFGCSMGPFALMNATGIPIAYHAQKTLYEVYGAFYKPADKLLQQMNSKSPWEIKPEQIIDWDVYLQVSERLSAVTMLVCGQILDKNICTAGDITRGAGIGLKWRKTPVNIFNRLGQDRVIELVQPLLQKWDMTIPRKMDTNSWIPDYISVEKQDNVGVLTFNRPEGLNAINPMVIDQLEKGFTQLEMDKQVETIIITGRGKAFVAGADIRFFVNHIKKSTIDEILEFTAKGQKLFDRIDHSKKKIVAIVNGLTLGGGLELALTADVIVALDHVLFAFPETGIGIYPGLGGTQRPIKRVGKNLTKFLIYSGNMIDAKNACDMGLIDKVVSWDEIGGLFENPHELTSAKKGPSQNWIDVDNFIDGKTVKNLLEHSSKASEWDWLLRKMVKKAPRALEIAEKLIDAERGPASELKYLKEIFTTDDALAGLQSVGKVPPKYQGH